MLASGNLDGLAQGLVGAGLLILGVMGSAPLALVHAGLACFEPGESGLRRLKILWIVIGGCSTLAAVLLAGRIDPLLAPYLPVAVLGPFGIAAAAGVAGGKLRAGIELGPLERWSNRLAPLVWLGIFADVVIRVFPKT